MQVLSIADVQLLVEKFAELCHGSVLWQQPKSWIHSVKVVYAPIPQIATLGVTAREFIRATDTICPFLSVFFRCRRTTFM